MTQSKEAPCRIPIAVYNEMGPTAKWAVDIVVDHGRAIIVSNKYTMITEDRTAGEIDHVKPREIKRVPFEILLNLDDLKRLFAEQLIESGEWILEPPESVNEPLPKRISRKTFNGYTGVKRKYAEYLIKIDDMSVE